ncbi:MAG: hypothetical protein IPO86_10015 [Saprospiraceae bacterium]|nr:hypothetical protein [Saprospiraceae bacterium]
MKLLDSSSFIEILGGINLAYSGIKQIRDILSMKIENLNNNFYKVNNEIKSANQLIIDQGIETANIKILNPNDIIFLETQKDKLIASYNEIREIIMVMSGVSSLLILYTLFAIGIEWEDGKIYVWLIKNIACVYFFFFVICIVSTFHIIEKVRHVLLFLILILSIFYPFNTIFDFTDYITNKFPVYTNLFAITVIGVLPLLCSIIIGLLIYRNTNLIQNRLTAYSTPLIGALKEFDKELSNRNKLNG